MTEEFLTVGGPAVTHICTPKYDTVSYLNEMTADREGAMNVLDATTVFDAHLATRARITRLIEAVGRPDFAPTLMEVIGRFLPVAHFSALLQGAKTGVQVVAAASRARDDTSSTIARAYARQYFRNDPTRRTTLGEDLAQHVALTHLRSSDLGHSPYRRECYDKPGIIERLSVTCGNNDTADSLNLYRTHQEGPFGPAEYEIAIETAALLMPFIRRHYALSASPAAARGEMVTRFAKRLESLPSGLAQREIEVCARALIGMSVEATALDLEIRPTSVTTYRQRAYHKLGISSQHELFALVVR
jgi:DNA-binding CsgD family transcriptional regulator